MKKPKLDELSQHSTNNIHLTPPSIPTQNKTETFKEMMIIDSHTIQANSVKLNLYHTTHNKYT